jgi:hypothetical protein
MKYLAFDLEIATPIPSGANWDDYRPFGVACAVTFGSAHRYPLMWQGLKVKSRMGTLHLLMLHDYLRDMVDKGYTLLTFAGCGFDFNVLDEETKGYSAGWKDLARNHVDMFFHILAAKGYCRGLDTLAKAQGLLGKPSGVHAAAIPQMWLDGRQHEVLDYCAGDVEMTLRLAERGDLMKRIEWEAKGGTQDGCDLPDGWLTVGEALQLPEPDTSGMENPWPRSKFTGWLDK